MKPLTFRLDQRPIPEAALRDEHSCELLRIWVAEKGLHCSIRCGQLDNTANTMEPLDWGVVLAATVRHVARSLQADGEAPDDLIARIARAFNDEIGDRATETCAVPVTLH